MRTFRLVFVSIVLGTASSLTSALLPCLFPGGDMHGQLDVASRSPYWTVERARTPTTDRITSYWFIADVNDGPATISDGYVALNPEDLVPDWAKFAMFGSEVGMRKAVVVRSGFPWPTLEGGLSRDGFPGTQPIRGHSAWILTRDPSANLEEVRFIPLKLRPLAALSSVAVWALPFAVVLAYASHLRSRARLARGLCVHCAHPLAGLPTCAECGHDKSA